MLKNVEDDDPRFGFTHDPIEDIEPEHNIDRNLPIDEMEPIDQHPSFDVGYARGFKAGYRKAGLKHIELLNNIFYWFGKTEDMRVGYWQLAFALGIRVCEGKDMQRISMDLCGNRATISKGAVQFSEENQIGDSTYMKREETRATYAEVRTSQLKDNE